MHCLASWRVTPGADLNAIECDPTGRLLTPALSSIDEERVTSPRLGTGIAPCMAARCGWLRALGPCTSWQSDTPPPESIPRHTRMCSQLGPAPPPPSPRPQVAFPETRAGRGRGEGPWALAHLCGMSERSTGAPPTAHRPPPTASPLALLMLIALLPLQPLSAAIYTVSVPDYQANPGTVLQVPVTLDNAAGLAQVRLQLNYDPQVVTLVRVSAGPLGAQFDLSDAALGGVVTMDFVRATPLGAGSGRLAMLEFRVNPGATTDLYSDLAIARFDLGDATGVRNIAAGQTLQTHNGSVKVSVSRDIDNESNGLPDWWESQHNLDLFSPAGRTDSDADSLSDFLEFAFGGHPLVPDDEQVTPVGSVQEYDGHQYLVVTFRRLKDAGNLDYVLQESEDLSAWESCDPDSRLLSPSVDLGNGMESVTVRWKQPLDGPGALRQGFMRIGVEQKP